MPVKVAYREMVIGAAIRNADDSAKDRSGELIGDIAEYPAGSGRILQCAESTKMMRGDYCVRSIN
ncbi:hypothetical protein MARLIPOL_12854 [Marinobacter lipolyticus SM19]|uniref:Uncharacterized protein n=1 Tax=Marinobacter lipolyticus SM19 TaxID=1318628 RepID=R8AZ42_9GAMM|nr:hypothetical protein MARLIPOL_12854 [Marinobacter lipolyticus SM19]